MKNYRIKLILFLAAFAVGTIAVFIFLQSSRLPFSFRNALHTGQISQSEQSPAASIDSLSFEERGYACGNFIAYKATVDNTKVIGIRADKKSLDLGKDPKTFDISTDRNLEIFLYDFGNKKFQGYEGLCFDLVNVGLEPVKLIAVSGKVTIYTSTAPKQIPYNMTIILEDVTFQTPDKNTINFTRIEIKNVMGGLMMG